MLWIELFIMAVLLLSPSHQNASKEVSAMPSSGKIIPGADNVGDYMNEIKGKRVGVFANQTSKIGKMHLVDSLLNKGVNIVRIFSPEHGFRGNVDAGEQVNDGKDIRTGLPIISLYGSHKKPTVADFRGIDILIFDIQDVGARFYTYISSLEYFMEAALENQIPLLILDRPNPNGWYIDGPVLDRKFRSFVGMQPVPIVYGMTIGEYSLMLAGEKWLSPKANTAFENNKSLVRIIKCGNYSHELRYNLPVNPSPNLRDMQAIYWYPSTCLFEGTIFSEGRGTEKPFQIIGHPDFSSGPYQFTPKPDAGAKSSKCFFKLCRGWNLSGSIDEVLKKVDGKIQISLLMDAYRLFPGRDSFFIPDNFDQKAGNDILRKQIMDGISEKEIRKSWEPGLKKFRAIRKKYLLYKDFKTQAN
jgi:uncharacterized protein YbbC (DUF1343 family)